MKISIIAAISSNNVIGIDNRLPWDIPEDLQNFKRLTLGKPVLMGRKTFESIGRVLPGRTNIIITRNRNYRHDRCRIFHNIDAALTEFSNCDEVMVIGGASFYEQLLPVADTLYLTYIDKAFEGDTFFPPFDFSEWIEYPSKNLLQSNPPYLRYSFRVYKRIDTQIR